MRVLAVFSGAFSAAIIAACYLLTSHSAACIGAVLGLMSVIQYRLHRGPDIRMRRIRVVLAGLCVGFLWYGIWTTAWIGPVQVLDGQCQMLNGEVLSAPVCQWDDRYSVSVRMTNSQPRNAKILLYADESAAELRPGDRIAVMSQFTSAEKNFDGEEVRYLNAQGVLLRAEAVGPLGISRPERVSARYWPALWGETLREAISDCFSEESIPLIRAQVTGDRSLLDEGFRSDLQRTGLAHTIAVSGMHMAVLASVLELLLGRGRRSTAVFLSLIVFLFCGLVGNTPSVIRAAIMILMLQAAPLLGRERDSMTSLGLALMLLLAWNPLAAANIGLQMSFAAVAGILLITEKASDWLLHRLKLDTESNSELIWHLLGIPRFLVGVLSSTLGASLFTVPLAAVHFGTISLIAPLANMAALWAVSLLFLVGLAGGSIGIFLPEIGGIIGSLADPLMEYLVRIVSALTRYDYAAVPIDLPGLKFWLGAVYALITISFLLPRWRRKLIPVGAAASALSLGALLAFSAWDFDNGAICTTVLDVGQGQCVAIRSGDYLMAVDCGSTTRSSPGDLAADYLQARGRGKLDLLVLTHFHADHASGAVRLLKRMDVKKLAIPDTDPENPLRKCIVACAAETGTEVCLINEDRMIVTGDNCRIRLIAPLGHDNDVNENCITVVASNGNYDVLITGDMDTDTEQRLLNHGPLPDVELMLAGHHGAASSNCFQLLNAVKPEKIAVSAGFENKYGHPAEEALSRFELVGAEVLRTDLQGTLSIRP